jgi:hypothetical protein
MAWLCRALGGWFLFQTVTMKMAAHGKMSPNRILFEKRTKKMSKNVILSRVKDKQTQRT